MIEEIVDEPETQASSSTPEDPHSLDASAGAAEGAKAEPVSTADASETAADAATSSTQLESSAGDAAAAVAAAEVSAADAPPAEAAAPSSSTGSEEQQLDPQIQQLIAECEQLKQEGNTRYAQGEYDEALQLYWQVGSWLQY
jgi:hypothetical protein